jgi:hypothetical protein
MKYDCPTWESCLGNHLTLQVHNKLKIVLKFSESSEKDQLLIAIIFRHFIYKSPARLLLS